MSQFRLRLKLLLADRTAAVAMIISTAVVLAVILSMKTFAAERSALPIGLCVEDAGAEAQELKAGICECDALYVYEGTKAELEDLLADGYINCIFTIPEGYGQRIEAYETEELVNVTAAEDDKIAVLCSDIVAGYMIDRICSAKAYGRYEGLDKKGIDNPLDKKAYRAYVEELKKDELFAFNFDVAFVNAGTSELTYRDISNSMLYMQVIAGFIGLLLMLTAFTSCEGVARECELGVARRLKTLPGSIIGGAVSQILAVILYIIPLPAAVAVLFGLEKGMSGAAGIFLISLVLDTVFVICFFIAAYLTRGVSAYQMVGSAIIIIFGVMGFLSIFMGMLGTDIFEYTPLAWYIKRFIANI